ncbi:MAG: cobaltochelatase CobS [Candidatus Poriferisodalaceae bacterium]
MSSGPTQLVDAASVFGFDSHLQVPASALDDLDALGDHSLRKYVPEVDDGYRFDSDVTLAILAGFSQNRRTLIQGFHGTGKSTHVEQVAARLNWLLVRVNLDGHIARMGLVGRDAIVVRYGAQVTEFQEGILP